MAKLFYGLFLTLCPAFLVSVSPVAVAAVGSSGARVGPCPTCTIVYLNICLNSYVRLIPLTSARLGHVLAHAFGLVQVRSAGKK